MSFAGRVLLSSRHGEGRALWPSLVPCQRSRSGECVLCGNHALLQDEDIFPTWARNELIANLADALVDNQLPQRVILRASEPCNSGLGREFENPVAPILKPLARGAQATLDREQMALVAAWSWLKTIEYVLGRDVLWTAQGRTTHTARSLALWRGELENLRRDRRPPRGYLLRLATIGSPTSDLPYRSFTPEGWGQQHADLTGLDGVGLLMFETRRTNRENAAKFIQVTRADSRASLVWPLLRQTVTIGATTVPLNHADQWRTELNFHPDSGWGGRVAYPGTAWNLVPQPT